MKCADVMNRNLEWLTEKDTVFQAATGMANRGRFPSDWTRASGSSAS